MHAKKPPTMKSQKHTSRVKVNRGSSGEWAFTYTQKGRKVGASATYLKNGKAAGTFTCTLEDGVLVIGSAASRSKTQIRVTKRRNDVRLVEVTFDNESQKFKINMKRPLASPDLAKAFAKARARKRDREAMPASLRLMRAMSPDVLDQWRETVRDDRQESARTGAPTPEDCENERDDAMADIGGELVVESALLVAGAVSGPIGWLFAIGVAWVIQNTEEDFDDVDEEFNGCMDEAEEPA